MLESFKLKPGKMDRLPHEVVTHLIGYLDVGSLLRLRATNKYFYSIVRSYRVTSLSVSTYGKEDEAFGRFFHTNEPFKAAQSFSTSNHDFFRSKVMKLLLGRIKRLHADVLPAKQAKSVFNVNLNLNHLESLEVLQIRHLTNRRNGCLRLPNLQVLSIGYLFGDNLKLETPKLFAFRSKSRLSYFEFEFPETITHMGCEQRSWNGWDLDRFVNLEYTYSKHGYLPDFGDDATNYPKLKEVHFFSVPHNDMNMILPSESHKKAKIKLFLNGIQIKEIDEVEELLTKGETPITYRTQLYATYYNRLSDRLPWVKEIDYSTLVTLMNEIPEDFYSKFCQISTVSVSQPVDQQRFARFLSGCRTVRVLELSNTSFDRSFFVNLSDYCPYLKKLNIVENKESINLSFVTKFEYLQSLSIDQEVSFYKMNQILSHFDHVGGRSGQLNYFEFKFRGKICIVECVTDEGFQVKLDDRRKVKFNDRKSMYNILKIISK